MIALFGYGLLVLSLLVVCFLSLAVLEALGLYAYLSRSSRRRAARRLLRRAGMVFLYVAFLSLWAGGVDALFFALLLSTLAVTAILIGFLGA